MKLFRLLLLLTPFLIYLASCAAKSDAAKKVYFYSISRQNSKEIKDSLYASSDIDAVDSTVRHYYQLMDEYNEEKKKVSNNIYVTKPLEWHVLNMQGEFVTSVSDEEVAAIQKKYQKQ